MRKRIFTIRHHGMTQVDEDDIDGAINDTYGGTPQYLDEVIDTGVFATDLDGVNWELTHEHIWKRACELRKEFGNRSNARIAYFGGFPEVAAALALGAYLGDEWKVETYDLREEHNWAWPTKEASLKLSTSGTPLGVETISGPAALVVEISGSVLDSHVRQFIGEKEGVAAIRISPAVTAAQYCDLVRSAADVAEIRYAVRSALAILLKARPNVTKIHAFVAAPPSVAFAIGQELRIRNSRPVQTYRHRNTIDGPTMAPAMLLSPSGPGEADISLTTDEIARAASLRTRVWAKALKELEAYAALKRQEMRANERWYERLSWRDLLARVRPFPTLPPIYSVIHTGSTVDDEPMPQPGDYSFGSGVWRVSDRLLVQLDTALDRDEKQLRTLIRMFLLHEASHKGHSLVKGKVDEVGKFPNCLERADYTADLYAIVHELDRGLYGDAAPLDSFELLRSRVSELIELVIRSFWGFENRVPIVRMEVRRLRRHMNWYWQLARVQRAETPLQLFAILARQPFVEFAGLEQSVVGRRVYFSLERLDQSVGLEVGLVLDNEELWRVKNSVTVPLDELLASFRMRDHTSIKKWFGRIFEDVSGSKHALPDATYV